MENNKTFKKIVVNFLTLSRVLATLSMPILCTYLSSISFLFLIGMILFTDLLDGKLARKLDVSTLFGSIFDMSADKLLGITLLFVLSFTYPIMLVPAGLEILIASVNINSILKGNKAKSRWIGKIKMGVSFVSILSLLMIGASPEINLALENFGGTIKDIFEAITEFFINNKKVIENTVIPATIIAESATLVDYVNDYNKVKNNESKKLLEELKKYREYLKDYKFKNYMNDILFNEEYHKETVDEPLLKKLMPNKNKIVDK